MLGKGVVFSFLYAFFTGLLSILFWLRIIVSQAATHTFRYRFMCNCT